MDIYVIPLYFTLFSMVSSKLIEKISITSHLSLMFPLHKLCHILCLHVYDVYYMILSSYLSSFMYFCLSIDKVTLIIMVEAISLFPTR